MKSAMALVFSLLFLFPIVSNAQQESDLMVVEMAFCTDVEDRTPVGADTVFSSTVERIFCFTKITGAVDTTAVTHIWYYNDEQMAKVELAVKSEAWRTWSSKQIMKEWIGTWRVDIVSESGDVLESKEFLVEASAD